MKSVEQIQQRLNLEIDEKDKTIKRFEEYDNVEDMHLIDQHTTVIEVLKWVLGK